jgi:hypothetical protein
MYSKDFYIEKTFRYNGVYHIAYKNAIKKMPIFPSSLILIDPYTTTITAIILASKLLKPEPL